MSVVILFALINISLVLYIRTGDFLGRQWYYVQKNDDAFLFGRINLLEGGYLELKNVYVLAPLSDGSQLLASAQFSIEQPTFDTLTLLPTRIKGSIRFGPNEIRNWGVIPRDSIIYRQLLRVQKEALMNQ